MTTQQMPAFDLRARIRAVDEPKRRFELVWSTGAPVQRPGYTEALSMHEKHIRLGRLNSSAPVLNTHSSWSLSDQIGVVEEGSARVVDGKGVAWIRLSDRPEVAGIVRDVEARVIRNVSIGYLVHKFVETHEGRLRTAVDWEPFEISLVPIPADAGAQLRAHVARSACTIERLSVADSDRHRRLRLALAKSREL
jgi:hypothetical protein